MTSVATRWRSWPVRWRCLTPQSRLLLAIAVSLILHLVLLLLQFGQYGVGLPGLGWPDTERHARDQPALAMRVQPPVQRMADSPGDEVALPAPMSVPNLLTSVPVDTFVMVPRYEDPVVTEAVVTAPSAGKKISSSPGRVALLSSTKQNLDFKVAQPVASDAELASTEAQNQSVTSESVADRDLAPAVPAQDLEETQALARRSADQEQSLKERQDQQLAAIADEAKKISEVLQKQEAAIREVSQREQLAQQLHDAEQAREQAQQRSREQLLREQDLEQKRTQQQTLERLNMQRLERQQQARRLAEQQLAEQQRIEQQRIEQQQIRQHNEQLLAERDAVAARQRAAQATQNNVQGASSVDELTGEPLAAPAKVRLDADKMFAGRSADFDRAGSALKASPNNPVPTGQRRSIFGSKTADVELNLYKQSWRQKIERNGRLNYSQIAKDRMHTDPVVMVSIRSDGSLDGVVILRSSGRPEMDDAVRRIAALNAPYSAFPPGLARKFDIIDIRQIWIFDDTLKIADQM